MRQHLNVLDQNAYVSSRITDVILHWVGIWQTKTRVACTIAEFTLAEKITLLGLKLSRNILLSLDRVKL